MKEITVIEIKFRFEAAKNGGGVTIYSENTKTERTAF